MMRIIKMLGCCLVIVYPVPAIAQTSAVPIPAAQTCPIELAGKIDAILDRPNFRLAHWGVLVQTLEADAAKRQTLYDRQGQKLFIPASNAKLLITAAALQKFGTNYRVRTSIYGKPDPLKPNAWQLQVVGRGDPSLKDTDLQTLAQQLNQKGVQTISQLTLDDRYFLGDPVNPNWEWGDLVEGYGAVPTSLMVNFNNLELTLTPTTIGQPLKLSWGAPPHWTVENLTQTVGPNASEFTSITRDIATQTIRIRGQLRSTAKPEILDVAVVDPFKHFADRFQTALNRVGIAVQTIDRTKNPPDKTLLEIASHQSPTILDLVRQTNLDSDNLYAESLLQILGMESKLPRQPDDTATTLGLKTLRQALGTIGVDATTYQTVDASGLARRNWISPLALVQTLQGMTTQPNGRVYRASLPNAGSNGTLENRFRNTPAQGIVQAKTGTLTGAIGISGYITPKNHPPLAFSVLLNQSTDSLSIQRQAIDAVVVELAKLKTCL
jgi:serine-type D-Ala-D-Ala carboxypeptidase/endopeptidase (penicillin-binding protein 4)